MTPPQTGDTKMRTTNTKKPAKTRERKIPARITKIDQLVALLTRSEGASIAEMCDTTSWQKHSVRGAMAGAIRKKGFEVASEVNDGIRRYRIGGKQ